MLSHPACGRRGVLPCDAGDDGQQRGARRRCAACVQQEIIGDCALRPGLQIYRARPGAVDGAASPTKSPLDAPIYLLWEGRLCLQEAIAAALTPEWVSNAPAAEKVGAQPAAGVAAVGMPVSCMQHMPWWSAPADVRHGEPDRHVGAPSERPDRGAPPTGGSLAVHAARD